MRSGTFNLFFAFLVLFMLVSTLLGYDGIARLRRNVRPPFGAPFTLYTEVGGIPGPSDRLVLFVDSTHGRIIVWSWALAIPILCGFLAFKQERLILGGSLLFANGVLFGWIGLQLFLHAIF
ncbi:MAG: hypothetical protein ABSA47_09765 [Verrucomicrobiota bacterium]|jgi:hypothetical protein